MAIQNMGLVVAPLLVAQIKVMTNGDFFWVNAFFNLLSCLGLFINLRLVVIDRRHFKSSLSKKPSSFIENEKTQ